MGRNHIKTAASAFADDTVWIAGNKESAQRTVDISNQFFDINDIKINGAKSELLVMNSPLSKEDLWIEMGTEREKVHAVEHKTEIRFLVR